MAAFGMKPARQRSIFGGNFADNGTFTANTSSSAVHTFTGTTKTISGTNAIAIPYLTINGTTTNIANLTVSSALRVPAH